MKGIDTFVLKMIAIAAMLLDHIGAVLFPQYGILREIGRIAFPIFAYTLVEGMVHTHNVQKYMLRLGIFALLSEVPFDLAFFGTPLEFSHQNVFFTLFLGIVMLYLTVKAPTMFQKFMYLLGILLLSEFLKTDYNSMGLLMIFVFYYFRNQNIVKYLMVAFINIALMGGSQSLAVLALIPIALHNGDQGPKCKEFFYGFYPIHLLIIYFLSIIFK